MCRACVTTHFACLSQDKESSVLQSLLHGFVSFSFLVFRIKLNLSIVYLQVCCFMGVRI